MNIWTRELLARLRGEDVQISADDGLLRGQLLHIALLCHSTFFLDEHVLRIAFTQADLALHISMSIIIYDNSPELDHAMDGVKQLVFSSRKGAILLESYVGELVLGHSKGLSDGINDVWDNIFCASAWEFDNPDSARWLTNTTEAIRLEVYYNCVTGRVVVDGQSLQ